PGVRAELKQREDLRAAEAPSSGAARHLLPLSGRREINCPLSRLRERVGVRAKLKRRETVRADEAASSGAALHPLPLHGRRETNRHLSVGREKETNYHISR